MWLGMSLAAQGGKPGVTVRVLNPAGIPPKTLLRAEQVATAIFDQAGVEITWRPCPPCGVDLAPNEYRLHLLTSRPPHLHGDTMGYAVLMPERDGAVSYGGVFWQAVEQAAASLNAGEAALLGATMAHELGHILLGSSGHAWTGVMCRRLQKAEARMAASGELRFTREQAERIQAGLTGRGVGTSRPHQQRRQRPP
jgi:hypothetical protein